MSTLLRIPSHLQKNFSFDSKLVMVSFDIESLFTSIPLQETIDLCVENLFKDRTHVDNLSKTLSRGCLLGPCLNHLSYLIRNSINSMMELQWVPH